MKSIRLIIVFVISGIILLIPLIAMQFTDEVNWTFFDFVVAGILLLGTGFLFEFITRNIKKTSTRIIIFLVLLAILILVWAELAVGIFGTPFSGN